MKVDVTGLSADRILELIDECIMHSEDCYKAGAYETALYWTELGNAYANKLQIVTLH